MKVGSFECHITLEPQHRDVVDPLAKQHKFKTSVIAGDEEMGDEKYLYCTTHDSNYDRIVGRMDTLINNLPPNVKVLRKKVEEIKLDERFT